MRNGTKIALTVVGVYALITVLHLWLNVGFDKLGIFASKKQAEAPFRVGFLPVT